MTRITLNTNCDIDALEAYLSTVEVVLIDEEFQENRSAVRVQYNYHSHLLNSHAKVILSYDRGNSIIQEISIETQAMDVRLIKNEILEELRKACFLIEE